jgi:hypothetical protein
MRRSEGKDVKATEGEVMADLSDEQVDAVLDKVESDRESRFWRPQIWLDQAKRQSDKGHD